jgi:hypothetical protein
MNAPRLAGFVLAGAAATGFMDRVDKVVYLLQPEDVHKREAAVEDLTGPGELARRIMRAAGREPSHDEAVAAGRLVHVTFGISSAVAYGFVASGVPVLRAGNGLLFGLLLAPANLVVVPAVGLAPPIWKFPRETTIRSIVYHLAYGLALESLARLLRLHGDSTRSS